MRTVINELIDGHFAIGFAPWGCVEDRHEMLEPVEGQKGKVSS